MLTRTSGTLTVQSVFGQAVRSALSDIQGYKPGTISVDDDLESNSQVGL